jgi:hypothetical protein
LSKPEISSNSSFEQNNGGFCHRDNGTEFGWKTSQNNLILRESKRSESISSTGKVLK